MTPEEAGGIPGAGTGPRRHLAPAAASLAERVAAAIVVVAAMPFLALFLRAMATTSLWTDEIFSIVNFSGSGPVRSATYYFDANNHVFFNVLSGCLPWRGTMDPLGARAVSFAATLGLLALLFAFLLRRAGPLVAAAAVLSIATGRELLDLTLQARGYGLAAFLALTASVLAVRAVEGGGALVLAGLSVASVLGVWTLPTFALFGAPLLLFVFAVRRDRASFLAGLAALAGVALVYAPIASDVLGEAKAYGSKWGRQFASVLSVGEVLRQYALRPRWPFSAAVSLGLLGLLALLVFLPRRDPGASERLRGARLVLGAVLSCFAVCRLLETPLLRSTSFLAVPLLLSGALLAGESLRAVRTRGAVAVLLAVPLAAYGAYKGTGFQFAPQESWRDVARLLSETVPPGTRVHVPYHPEYLARHLPPGVDVRAPFDPAAFASGRLVVVDAPLLESDGRLEERPGLPPAAAFKFPQRVRAYQALLFAPPAPVAVVAVTDGEGRDDTGPLADRDLSTALAGDPPERLEVRLATGRRYRSLVVVRDGFGLKPELRARVADGGAPADVAPRWHWGDVTVLPLGDRPAARVELLPADGRTRLPRLREIWAYPLP